jgi:hypothetical protein
MAFRDRVKADDDVTWHKEYAIAQTSAGKFRVYEDGSYYSATSGGVGKKGKVMRGTDDKPVQFDTIAEAERWIDEGCRVWSPA